MRISLLFVGLFYFCLDHAHAADPEYFKFVPEKKDDNPKSSYVIKMQCKGEQVLYITRASTKPTIDKMPPPDYKSACATVSEDNLYTIVAEAVDRRNEQIAEEDKEKTLRRKRTNLDYPDQIEVVDDIKMGLLDLLAAQKKIRKALGDPEFSEFELEQLKKMNGQGREENETVGKITTTPQEPTDTDREQVVEPQLNSQKPTTPIPMVATSVKEQTLVKIVHSQADQPIMETENNNHKMELKRNNSRTSQDDKEELEENDSQHQQSEVTRGRLYRNKEQETVKQREMRGTTETNPDKTVTIHLVENKNQRYDGQPFVIGGARNDKLAKVVVAFMTKAVVNSQKYELKFEFPDTTSITGKLELPSVKFITDMHAGGFLSEMSFLVGHRINESLQVVKQGANSNYDRHSVKNGERARSILAGLKNEDIVDIVSVYTQRRMLDNEFAEYTRKSRLSDKQFKDRTASPIENNRNFDLPTKLFENDDLVNDGKFRPDVRITFVPLFADKSKGTTELSSRYFMLFIKNTFFVIDYKTGKIVSPVKELHLPAEHFPSPSDANEEGFDAAAWMQEIPKLKDGKLYTEKPKYYPTILRLFYGQYYNDYDPKKGEFKTQGKISDLGLFTPAGFNEKCSGGWEVAAEIYDKWIKENVKIKSTDAKQVDLVLSALPMSNTESTLKLTAEEGGTKDVPHVQAICGLEHLYLIKNCVDKVLN